MDTEKRYPLAEKFKAPQGEGLFTGTPFAFMRTVGCSVGHGVCHTCDTDFDKMYEQLGGGLFTKEELVEWAKPYKYACLTGGEPLDRDLLPLIQHFLSQGLRVNVETSGTKQPYWLENLLGDRAIGTFYVCVSPKPGYLESMIDYANEVKVIVNGLGNGPGWPTIDDAVRWADRGKLVYIQPRNFRNDPCVPAMNEVLRIVHQHPNLRVSAQLHKFIKTR